MQCTYLIGYFQEYNAARATYLFTILAINHFQAFLVSQLLKFSPLQFEMQYLSFFRKQLQRLHHAINPHFVLLPH